MHPTHSSQPQAASYWPVALGAASFAAFWALQWRLSPRLSRALFPSCYASSRLTDAQRREWDSRVASSVHAVFAGVMWLVCWTVQPSGLFEDPDRVGGCSTLSSVVFVVMAGYMLADALSMLAYMSWREMAPYQLHHCLAITGFVACVRHGTLHYFVMYRVATEISTPLVNQMWFYRVSGYRQAAPLANALNSAALTLTFACCRILPIPVYWLRVWTFLRGSGLAYMRQFPAIGTFWFAYALALDALNVVWFRRLVIGGLKLVRGGVRHRPAARDASE